MQSAQNFSVATPPAVVVACPSHGWGNVQTRSDRRLPRQPPNRALESALPAVCRGGFFPLGRGAGWIAPGGRSGPRVLTPAIQVHPTTLADALLSGAGWILAFLVAVSLLVSLWEGQR